MKAVWFGIAVAVFLLVISSGALGLKMLWDNHKYKLKRQGELDEAERRKQLHAEFVESTKLTNNLFNETEEFEKIPRE